MLDLVIRDAFIVDGTGVPGYRKDVAVKDGIITAVDKKLPAARREINGDGLLVTPGWVDIHTHYDGQAIWDPYLTPSSWHGVTTAVFGNCGVGFAPVRPDSHRYLINLMEGVEDIPESVLAEGLDFSWESFPQYMDALEENPRIMDIGTQIPHAALRFYVMGDRGADHSAIPTEKEIDQMSDLVYEALQAGAVGFSTSRTIKHKAKDGRSVPSLTATEPELIGIARAMKKAQKGVIEVNSDFEGNDFEIMRAVAEVADRPLSVLLLQVHNNPNLWKNTLAGIRRARTKGQEVTGQVGTRPIGMLMGLEASIHPFLNHPLWKEMDSWSAEERTAKVVNDESFRDRLITELPEDNHVKWIRSLLPRTFQLDEPINYEPEMENSVEEVAKRKGIDPLRLSLDWMLTKDGKTLLYHTFENYFEGDLSAIHSMLKDSSTICGLGDAGAHVGILCDSTSMTSMIDFWVKRRVRGPRLPLEFLVKKQTSDTARAYGFKDRGLIAPGYRADINIIDYDRLRVHCPEVSYDLPAGGRRILQKADGYLHTFVSGVEVMRNGSATGNLPGRLIRGV